MCVCVCVFVRARVPLWSYGRVLSGLRRFPLQPSRCASAAAAAAAAATLTFRFPGPVNHTDLGLLGPDGPTGPDGLPSWAELDTIELRQAARRMAALDGDIGDLGDAVI